MKLRTLPGKLIPIVLLLNIACFACSQESNHRKYLKKVIKKLNQIESATYYSRSEGWAPGDTAAFSIQKHYIKEYNNPLDTTIGASYVALAEEDTTKLRFCYDGNMRTLIYDEEKGLVLDSFKVRKLPFRPLNPPFFNYTKSILQYALQTNDSISIQMDELGDTLYVCLNIFEDKQVEFFGKAFYIKNQYTFGDNTSRYEIWINKSTDLPFKYRRDMSHNISIEACRGVELNQLRIEDFKASDYFPKDYEVRSYGMRRNAAVPSTLIGKVAPDWVLQDVNKQGFSLKEMKSKVIMLQFTSVNCGPCRASIPFLKQLVSEYNKEDFDFVAIENSIPNISVLRNYQNRNRFNYRFLISTKEVNQKYLVHSVPVFFLLDEKRVIQKVFKGYGKGTTDKEIREAIKELI